MSVHHLPLAVLAAEHRGDAQYVRLRWRTLDGRVRVLEGDDVCEVTARAGSDDFVLEGRAVREGRSEPLEDRADLGPPAPAEGGPEQRHRVVVRPHGHPGTGVAVVKSDLGLVQSRHGRRQESSSLCAHHALPYG